MVALKFLDLPEGHRQAIKNSLNARFLEILRENRRLRLLAFSRWALSNIWQITFYLALTAATFGVLYWLSRPAPNYDAERGAPWGERFKLGK